MKKLILISALLFSFNGWGITDYKPYDESAIAGEEIIKALKKAKSNNKYILLQMGGNWCPDCRTLGEYFSRPDIKKWLDERVILVSVDVGEWDRNLDIVEEYGNPISEGIPGFPRLWDFHILPRYQDYDPTHQHQLRQGSLFHLTIF